MTRILFPVLWLWAACLTAADPRPKPADYPAHAESARLAIGAEYLVHSFSNGSQMYIAPEYLVVDTAVYPHEALDVKRSGFALRITLQGKSKQADQTVLLHPEAPSMVAYSIASSINSVPPELRGAAGQRQPLPKANEPEAVADVVSRMALPEDVMHSGQGGYLYFAFQGKTKQIKAMDLIFGEGDSALVVKLF